MFLETRILLILAETPLHAGSGSGLGAIDLPIQRERATGYPIIQASGLKGALRSEAADGPERRAVFGPETNKADEHAGAFSPGDARVLLFPVRSLTGVFAWTTSVDALHRFCRDAQAAKLPDLPPVPDNPAINSALVSGDGVAAERTVVLEEFAFSVANSFQDDNDPAARWGRWLAQNALPTDDAYTYWREKMERGLVILPHDAFRDFLLHATEVVTRVRLEPDSKTVAHGALWTQEYLPVDSLLYAPVHATRLRTSSDKRPAVWAGLDAPKDQATAVLNWVADAKNVPHWLQIGGDETVGRGLVRLRWAGGAQ
ncbi:MAG: type III-B CRISPR module RAMP protein Cmr4 [Anaerolineae bacterium]